MSERPQLRRPSALIRTEGGDTSDVFVIGVHGKILTRGASRQWPKEARYDLRFDRLAKADHGWRPFKLWFGLKGRRHVVGCGDEPNRLETEALCSPLRRAKKPLCKA